MHSQFISIADILSDIRGGVGILQGFAAGARLIFIIRLTADHGGVIAAQLQRRHKQLDVLALCHVLQGRPQEGIGCHAACTHNAPRMRLLDSHLQPRHERMHDSRAERGRETVPVDGFALLLGVVRQIDDRCFESREGEIQRRILDVRIRQLVHFRVAVLRQLVDLRAARIADTEHAGNFIERLACCVVACAAEDFKLGVAFHHHDLAVTAGRDQCQKRRFQLRIRQISSRNVSPNVVHRNERLVHRKRQRLAEVRADEQRTDQSGRAGRGNRVHVVLVHFRVLERCSVTRTTASMCRRDAISGTTPPYSACVAICVSTTLDRIFRPSSMTAAAVSSHEDSMQYFHGNLLIFLKAQTVFRARRTAVVRNDAIAELGVQRRRILGRAGGLEDGLGEAVSLPHPAREPQ